MANDTSFVREIEVDEEIYTKQERPEKAPFLSLEDQMGNIKLNLLVPIELSDQEPRDHLIVRAPTYKETRAYRNAKEGDDKAEVRFFGGCCVGVKTEDVGNMKHAKDADRLQKLVTNFIV